MIHLLTAYWFLSMTFLYFRVQAEVAHTCRGTISLHGALIHTVDSYTFVISNGGTQTFHIKGKVYYFSLHECGNFNATSLFDSLIKAM
jgi:hypothetical protein